MSDASLNSRLSDFAEQVSISPKHVQKKLYHSYTKKYIYISILAYFPNFFSFGHNNLVKLSPDKQQQQRRDLLRQFHLLADEAESPAQQQHGERRQPR
jgi:hypothetical protein